MNTVILSTMLLSSQFAGANKPTKPAPMAADFNLVAIGRNNSQMDQQVWKSGAKAIPAGMQTAMMKSLKKIPKMDPEAEGYTYAFGFSNSPSISNATVEVAYEIFNLTKKTYNKSFSNSVVGWRSSATGFLIETGQIRYPMQGEQSQLSIVFAAGSKTELGTLTKAIDGNFFFKGQAAPLKIEVGGSDNKMVTLTFENPKSSVELSVNFIGVRLGQVELKDANEPHKIRLDMSDPKITGATIFTRQATKKIYKDLPLIPELGL